MLGQLRSSLLRISKLFTTSAVFFREGQETALGMNDRSHGFVTLWNSKFSSKLNRHIFLTTCFPFIAAMELFSGMRHGTDTPWLWLH
jgi:hypothetical protein